MRLETVKSAADETLGHVLNDAFPGRSFRIRSWLDDSDVVVRVLCRSRDGQGFHEDFRSHEDEVMYDLEWFGRLVRDVRSWVLGLNQYAEEGWDANGSPVA